MKKRVAAVFGRTVGSPWLTLMITAIAYGTLALLRLHHFDYDPTAFIVVGDQMVDEPGLPSELRVLEDSKGYDGQFFYRLALDPFTTEPTDFGIRLDLPGYRQQRILYPLIVWVLAGGGTAALVPGLLIAVNWMGLAAIGWLSGALARSAGRNPSWGLLLAFYPGFVLTLSRDLSEIATAALLLWGLLLLRHSREIPAVIILSVAVICRETTLLLPAATAAALILAPRGDHSAPRLRGLLFLIPLLVYAGWQVFLCERWGTLPVQRATGGVGIPFSGLLQFVKVYWPPQDDHQWLLVREAGFLFVVAAVTGWSLWRGKSELHLALAWVLYLGLAELASGKDSAVRTLEKAHEMNPRFAQPVRAFGAPPLAKLQSSPGRFGRGRCRHSGGPRRPPAR